MAYETSVSIAGQTGAIGLLNFGNIVNFSQIFSGSPQYYPGSLIQVQEIFTIGTVVAEPLIVDVDFSWFSPRRRLGTYQIIDSVGLTLQGEENEGYLTSTIHRLQKKSFYTITANPNTIVAQHEQIALENCNFYTVPEVYLFPNNPVPQAGFRLYDVSPTFLGSITLSKAPLADTPFNVGYSGVGLYLSPGVEGNFVKYEIAIINDIYTDYPSSQVPQCQFLAPNCQSQFAAFLVGTPNVYETQAICDIAVGGIPSSGVSLCFPFTYICPTDPSQTFIYYQSTGD